MKTKLMIKNLLKLKNKIVKIKITDMEGSVQT